LAEEHRSKDSGAHCDRVYEPILHGSPPLLLLDEAL
jgi:hypothetical protein